MGILDTLKGVSNVVKEIGDIDLNRQIIDLQNEVYGLIEENYELRSEIRELNIDLKESEEAKGVERKLKFKDNMYFFVDDGEEKGPFCSACWDKKKQLIRLHDNSWGVFICPVCTRM